MALLLTITKGASNPNIMSVKAGEAFHFSHQLMERLGSPALPLAGRELVYVLYTVTAGKRTKVASFDGFHATDIRGDTLQFEVSGDATEAHYGKTLKWDLAERGKIGFEPILSGNLIIGESAPDIARLSTAPRGRYITRIIQIYNPATANSPDFTTIIEPYPDGVVVPPIEPPVDEGTVYALDFSNADNAVWAAFV